MMYAWSSTMKQTPAPGNWCIPGLDLALPCYKLKMEWHAQGTQHQMTPCCGQSHLQAKAWTVQNEDTVASKERHLVFACLERFHHCCFAREVSIITDHKPLVAILKKCGNPFAKNTMHSPQGTPILGHDSKPGPELLVTDWLSRHNHTENKDVEIHNMDMQYRQWQTSWECMSIPQIQQATAQDDHLQWLKGYIIIRWPENEEQIPKEIRIYWMFWDDMVVISGIIMKGRHVIIPEILKTQQLDQLDVNHME